MSVDLHLHTLHSDGSWAPADLVERAVDLKLSHIAITDHDTTAGIAEARSAAAGRLEVITGIEINTVWRRPDGTSADVHVLGYFFDVESMKLKELLKLQQDARRAFLDETIASLSRAGVNLTLEHVISQVGLGSIGRPHITRAIVECGGASDVDDAWEKFMARSSPYYVERRSVTPALAVEVLCSAGAVTSIAHPHQEAALQALIDELKPLGLAALEAYHRSHDLPDLRRLIQLAHQNGLAVSGGSDCHGAYKEYPAVIGTVLVPPEVVRELQCRHQVAN